MSRRTLTLVILSIIVVIASGVLFALRYIGSGNIRTITLDELRSLPAESHTYHSVNNWLTEEDTDFTGVTLDRFMDQYDISGEEKHLRFIAPDEYFWPAVGDKLTVNDLCRANGEGISPVLAYQMGDLPLDPEPKGTGPIRLVIPQYEEGEINKPSWVSNVRLIEVQPLPNGFGVPDAKDVRMDQVLLYGKDVRRYPYGLWLPILVLLIGVAILIFALLYRSLRA